MIGAWHGRDADARVDASRVASSLGLFAGVPSASWQDTGRAFWHLDGPRPAKPRPSWRPGTAPDHSITLLDGWIDNAGELGGELGCPPAPASVYAAAVARWGPRADAHIIGHYSAITVRADGTMRLARSPWSAPPLVYGSHPGAIMAASVPRALFAAGFPEVLNRTRVLDNLANNLSADDASWFEGIRRVPQGAIVELGGEPGARPVIDRWYDPLALPEIRLPSDDAYVEAANALLGEAVAKALPETAAYGLMMSGGLDSSLIASEILRQAPDRTLDTFTFVPAADWDGLVPPDLMGDERPLVEEFARMHPRIRPHFSDNPGGGFDTSEREMFLALGGAPGHLITHQAFHGVWRAAAAHGCQWLFHGAAGNDGFSLEGSWSYREDLVRGHWRQLYLTLRDRRGDHRPLWRKFLALCIVPHLPAGLRDALRRMVHGAGGDPAGWATLIRPDAAARLGVFERLGPLGELISRQQVSGRDAYRALVYHIRGGEDDEAWQAFEQIYGVRQRDIAAYRPLLEFCSGLPTRQFVSGGQQRWLAKRMAIGRLPEAQRLNPRYGRFQVDWHARLTPRLGELKAEVARIERHPWLGEILDTTRMNRLLDEWPEVTPWVPEEHYPRMSGVPGAIQAMRFADFVEGRNDV